MSDEIKVKFSSFVKLLVRDLEKSAAFYETVMGIKSKIYKKSKIAGRSYSEYMYRIDPDKHPAGGNTAIILMAFDDAQVTSGSEVIMVVNTPELRRFIERLVAAGGKVLQEPYPIVVPAGLTVQIPGGMLCLLSDNEGHLIEAVGTGWHPAGQASTTQ